MKSNNIYSIIIIFLFHLPVFTQNSLNINDYKYVSVPERFDFLKTSDQYQLNSLTEFLLKKNGFIVMNELKYYPSDLAENACLLLDVNVEKIKSFLKTKLQVQFKNCKNQIIFKSEIGISNEKDFKTAFHEALRASFISIGDANYNYSEKPFQLNHNNIIRSGATQVDQNDNNQNLRIKTIPTSYGFDFVTSNKEILFSLHQTICDGVYIIDKLTGTAYRRGDKWVREYIKENTITIEPLIEQK